MRERVAPVECQLCGLAEQGTMMEDRELLELAAKAAGIALEWPQGEAALSDCTLLKKATPAERDKLLHEMADIGHDMRASYAKKRLAERYITPNVMFSGLPTCSTE